MAIVHPLRGAGGDASPKCDTFGGQGSHKAAWEHWQSAMPGDRALVGLGRLGGWVQSSPVALGAGCLQESVAVFSLTKVGFP